MDMVKDLGKKVWRRMPGVLWRAINSRESAYCGGLRG